MEIFSTQKNVHFPTGNPSGTGTQFAAKWTPTNYLMYHSIGAEGVERLGEQLVLVLGESELAHFGACSSL